MKYDPCNAKLRLARAKRVLRLAKTRLLRAKMYLAYLKFIRIKNAVILTADEHRHDVV
jgi:hypothetical protein